MSSQQSNKAIFIFNIIYFVCTTSAYYADAQTLLYEEGFESGFPSGWTSTPTGVYDSINMIGSPSDRFSITNSVISPAGGYNLLLKNCDPENVSPGDYHEIQTGTYSTIGYSGIRVRVRHRKTGTFNPTITLEWSGNGVDWTNLTYPNSSGSSWTQTAFLNLPGAANNLAALRFRFYYTATNLPSNNPNYLNCNNLGISNYRLDDFEIYYTSILPISILHFTAKTIDDENHLLWATATETNNAYFSLERSTNGVDFQKIAEIPGAGNSAATRNYTYTDRSPLNGVNYYRLRQVDFDGAYTFSPVRRVVFGEANGVRLQPVPVTETLQVLLENGYTENIVWSVFDQSGRLVLNGQEAEETAQFDVDVQTLLDGIYMLRLSSGQLMHTTRFVKQ